jgi:hypothetical protein
MERPQAARTVLSRNKSPPNRLEVLGTTGTLTHVSPSLLMSNEAIPSICSGGIPKDATLTRLKPPCVGQPPVEVAEALDATTALPAISAPRTDRIRSIRALLGL